MPPTCAPSGLESGLEPATPRDTVHLRRDPAAPASASRKSRPRRHSANLPGFS